MKNPLCTGYESQFGMSRRSFLNQLGMGLGGMALGSMVNPLNAVAKSGPALAGTHFPGTASALSICFNQAARPKWTYLTTSHG